MIQSYGISGLVVKSIVAIDGPRVRFTADASRLYFCFFLYFFFSALRVEPRQLSIKQAASLLFEGIR